MQAHIQERITKIQKGEVPEGYQKTKVGIIPTDWESKAIKSVTSPDRKYGIVDGPFGSNLKTIHYRTEGIPIITSGYVTEGKFEAVGYLYVDEEKFNQEKRSAVYGGDIVMAKIGARCGASAILPKQHEKSILSGNALKIAVDEKRHNTYFVWQVLWNLYMTGKIEPLKTTGAQPAISISNLKKFQIPLPPFSEQQKIAEILSTWDDAIRLQQELIAQKKTQKRGLMQLLLSGKIRITEMGKLSPEAIKKRVDDIQQGIVPKGYQKTKLGIIPDEWKVTSLNTIAKRVVTINDGGQHPVLTISAASGFLNQSERFSKVIAGKNIEKYLLLQKYDFAYNKGNSKTYPQGCVYCLTYYERALVPNVYYCFRIFDNSIAYYKHYFLAGQLNQQLKRIINSGVRNDGLLNLNVSDFFKVLVLRPLLEEQEKIADILTTADQEIELLETELEQLRQQKKGLMQLLLTGKIRVAEFHKEGTERRV